MTDSADDDTIPARAPTRGLGITPDRPGSPAHPATEAARLGLTDAAGWERTSTAAGAPRSGGAVDRPGQAGQTEPADSLRFPAQGPGFAEERFGPGVPVSMPAASAAPAPAPAEEVWRTGQLPRQPPQRGRWRRRAGAALTAALLIACGVVIYLRLHHTALAVTGVAITAQVKNGCAVDVTGRISTTGAPGTVTYQWVITPQATAPQPLSQSVTAGQSAVYVTVSDQGTGHGQRTQQVTLQVLGPGQGRASTHVDISC